MGVRPEWRQWFAEFQHSIASLRIQDLNLELEADAERQSVALALFGRLLSEFATAIVLDDAGGEVAFRSYCRSTVECALHFFSGRV